MVDLGVLFLVLYVCTPFPSSYYEVTGWVP